KRVAVMSTFAQSTNQKCNAFQVINLLALESMSTPEQVIEMAAHAGWGVSSATIHTMVASLICDARRTIKDFGSSGDVSPAYDNFDVTYTTEEPTVEKQGSFMSVTSCVFFKLAHVTKDVLKYSCKNVDSYSSIYATI
ncbi:hypothetical protein K439DRAFT_1347929, partial [Ramaria rubella]